MQPLITVLVPVYNREKFLHQCLDSICTQTYPFLEILCIDNASTDRSLDILKEYAAKDTRIRVIAKTVNKGYACSINTGIEQARGEYIGIVESDDWAEPTMFEKLAQEAVRYPQADVIYGNYYLYNPSKAMDKLHENIPAEFADRLVDPRQEPRFLRMEVAIWCGIYKRSFVQENKIVLNEAPDGRYQDTSFWLATLCLARYIYFTKVGTIHYRQDNPTSSVHQADYPFAIPQEMQYAQRLLGDRLKPFWAEYNRFKLQKYWWNAKRVSPASACRFLSAYAPEVRHMILQEPMQWQKLGSRMKVRTYLWIYVPRLFCAVWRVRGCIKKVETWFGRENNG